MLHSLLDDLRLLGFDSLLRAVETIGPQGDHKYPPFNLIRNGDDSFRIEMALSGYSPDKIEVTLHNRVLTIRTKDDLLPKESTEESYIHRGLAMRKFSKTFLLAELIEIDSITMENGLLTVDLTRLVPEEKKAKQFEIGYTRAALPKP